MKYKKFLLIIFLIIASISVMYLSYYFIRSTILKNSYDELNNLAHSSSDKDADSIDSQLDEQNSSESDKEPVEIPIDFKALKERNPDIYAWIDIDHLNIHYPILQHPTNDSYYLYHTVDHASGLPGSVYTEKLNAKDFSDFNTLIYAHNMENGTMFNNLEWYMDPKLIEEKRDIVIYTPTEKRVYRVFAAVLYDNRYIPYEYDFSTESGQKAFIDSLYDSRNLSSHVLDDVEITSDSKIITLSTCVTRRPNERYLVVAEYVGDE